MKINTYHKYGELYKTAAGLPGGIADEGLEAAKRLSRHIDEAGELATPAFKALLEGIGDSASGIARDLDDIFGYAAQIIAEAQATKRAIDSGELVQKLRQTEDAFLEAERKRKKHWASFQRSQAKRSALAAEMGEMATKYDGALKAAAEEGAGLRQKISQMNEQIKTITDEATQAVGKLDEAMGREAELVKELGAVKKLLSETVQRADEAESALEILRKEHAELTALYEKTLKEADEAQEAFEAAQKAGVTGPALDGLGSTAKAKKEAAGEIGKRLTKGDEAAEQTLEQSAREARKKKPKGDSRRLDPELDPKAIPEDAGGAFRKGYREGLKELGKDIATKGLVGVGKAALRGLGVIALFGLIGAAVYYNRESLWSYFVNEDLEKARKNAKDFDAILRDAHAKLSKVKFKDGSTGQQMQQSYLGIMQGFFGVLPEMVERSDDDAFIQQNAPKLQTLLQQTEIFLQLKDTVYALDLESPDGWNEAVEAVQRLDAAGKALGGSLEGALDRARTAQPAGPRSGQRPGGGVTERKRPDPDPNDKGIQVLGETVYLSQYPELDPATRSAAPYLIKKVLLSPTGLSFWDPEGKWGGGYISNRGSIADQVMRHIRFFLNPRAVDSDWAYGPINNERKLRKFMRKNMPKAGRKPGSGYKSTRREYRKKKPRLAFSNNINISNVDSAMENRKNRLKMLEKIASSTNRTNISTENIEKYADSVSKEYYQGALRGLDDQYAKSYYTGLKSMYDQKLGGGKADYKSLYEPHGGTGTEILESSHPKSVVVSDAMGNGGLVENVLEQQRHDIGVALSTPTGNFRGKHANLVAALTKIANAADDSNQLELSEIVDKAIEDIVSILKS